MKLHKLFLTTLAAGSLAVVASCSSKSTQAESAPVEETQEVSTAKGMVHVLAQGEVFDINQTPQCLTIIDFNATWCGPCKAFGPIFEEAAEKYSDKVKFISVDVDVHKDLAESLQINSIPAILFIYPDGTKDMSVGLMDSDEFCGKIDSALNK